jgi:hypothetical protein
LEFGDGGAEEKYYLLHVPRLLTKVFPLELEIDLISPKKFQDEQERCIP